MKKIKIIRILIATIIIMAFFWLGWREIQNFGMFRILPNKQPDLNIGTSVFVVADGKVVNSYAIEEFKRGWLIILLGWPFVLFFKLLGFGEGYSVGEFFRWKFVVNESLSKELREKISIERSEMRTATFYRRYKAERLTDKANDIYAAAQKEKEKTAADERRIHVLRMTLEEQTQNAEKLRHDFESTKRELANAKEELVKAETRNRKLKKKLRARLGKWIDEPETAEIL